MADPSPPTVLIFGPSGNVGSHAALAAHAHGATVALAMRDPSKAIPALAARGASPPAEDFRRVQADLTQPATVAAAVRATGATRAFMYLAHGAGDGMRPTLQALRDAGVTFAVLLSSYTVGAAPFHGAAAAVTPDELIAWAHARVELALRDVFGPRGYVALRPGGFATNLLQYGAAIAAGGEARIFGAAFRTDLVCPEDMGAVAGRILATQDRPREEEDGDAGREVYLFGPQVLSMRDAVERAARVLGREVTVVEIDEDEARSQFDERGMPKVFADYIVRRLVEVKAGKAPGEEEQRPKYQEGVDNVKKYTGRESMAWEDWVRANKARFEA